GQLTPRFFYAWIFFYRRQDQERRRQRPKTGDKVTTAYAEPWKQPNSYLQRSAAHQGSIIIIR
ncbi:MAG: hypothetical protein DMG67_10500, partial [Acidobacteria bacterium]